MNKKSFLLCLTAMVLLFGSAEAQQEKWKSDPGPAVYNVYKVKKSIKPTDKWNKAEWKKVKPVKIVNFMGDMPAFKPYAEAKMMYDDNNIYVMFKVEDQFVISRATEINGPVWRDSAVEFFFAPNSNAPKDYFNLEINAGGTPLLGHESGKRPSVDDIKRIEIVSSLPKKIDPQIATPVTWTISVRIPLDMIENYIDVNRPAPGVSWKANFYKIAERSSNIHFITWSEVKNPKPNFHLPAFFGTLNFQ